MTLPGGHFFQDRIAGVTGDSMTSIDPGEHPGGAEPVHASGRPGSSKAANAAALGVKAEAEGAAGAAAVEDERARAQRQRRRGLGRERVRTCSRQRGYVTVLPPGNLSPNAPTQGYFHTTIYYDKRQTGLEGRGERALEAVRARRTSGRCRRTRSCTRSTPARCSPSWWGRRSTTSSCASRRRRPAPTHQPPNVRYDGTTGLDLLKPYEHRVPVQARGADGARDARRTRTISTATSRLASTGSTEAPQEGGPPRLQDRRRRVLGDRGDEHARTRPSSADRSFHRAIKGRTFSLYYTGSNLHMVVLRVHDRSYWVVNTLLDSLSNETMLAIATGLKPLTGVQVESGAMATVGIFGAGWVGLVTGVCFAELGHDVVVRDVVPEKIEALRARRGAVPRDRRSGAARAQPRAPPVHTRGRPISRAARSSSCASTRRRRSPATPTSRACGASSTTCPSSTGARSS